MVRTVTKAEADGSELAFARLKTRSRGVQSPGGPSLSERAYQALTRAIQQGEFEPNTRLTEVDLAQWLRMSRTPVREAMRRLESEGVLVTEPFRGATVVALGERELCELYAIRELLEVAAAGWCAVNASESELNTMRDILAREERAAAEPAALYEVNRELHRAICNGAHNAFLLKALASVHGSFARLGKWNLVDEARAKASMAEHRRLVAAISKRDRNKAEATAREHVRTSLAQRLKALRKASTR